MVKMKNHTVEKHLSKFYKGYVDNIINPCKKKQRDQLFEDLHNHHENIEVTMEVDLTKFLETNIEFK